MNGELFNLYLFFAAIGKTGLMTGIGPAVAIAIAVENQYVFRWAKCLGMPVLGGTRKNQLCKVLARGKLNSCLIQFPDGLQAVTSRNALRKAR
jgi:hypothetical protein